MSKKKFPRYFEQYLSGNIIRIDDSVEPGLYLHRGGIQRRSLTLTLNYVTGKSYQNWREITEAQALVKVEGGTL